MFLPLQTAELDIKDLDEGASPEDLMLGFVSSEKGKVRAVLGSRCSGACLCFSAACGREKQLELQLKHAWERGTAATMHASDSRSGATAAAAEATGDGTQSAHLALPRHIHVNIDRNPAVQHYFVKT